VAVPRLMRKALDGHSLREGAHGCTCTTNESFAGEPVEADVTGMQSALDSSLIAWLAHLKAAAESKG
jgi:hypothetical protein